MVTATGPKRTANAAVSALREEKAPRISIAVKTREKTPAVIIVSAPVALRWSMRVVNFLSAVRNAGNMSIRIVTANGARRNANSASITIRDEISSTNTFANTMNSP
jgi:hypothetical protein